MYRQTCSALLVVLLGMSVVRAQPKAAPDKAVPTVRAVLELYNLEKNVVFIRTENDNVLPPLIVGRDVKFFVDDREITNLRALKPEELKKLVKRNVTVSFRDEGRRSVADEVRTLGHPR